MLNPAWVLCSGRGENAPNAPYRHGEKYINTFINTFIKTFLRDMKPYLKVDVPSILLAVSLLISK